LRQQRRQRPDPGIFSQRRKVLSGRELLHFRRRFFATESAEERRLSSDFIVAPIFAPGFRDDGASRQFDRLRIATPAAGFDRRRLQRRRSQRHGFPSGHENLENLSVEQALD